MVSVRVGINDDSPAKVFFGSFEIAESVKLKGPRGIFFRPYQAIGNWPVTLIQQGWTDRLFDYLPINHRARPQRIPLAERGTANLIDS